MGADFADAFVLARISEAECIGCTLCIASCPVDAIVGAGKLMHTVLADRCTGCALCLPPCPVDCIALVPRTRAWTPADAEHARLNEQARAMRLARRADRPGAKARTSAPPEDDALRSRRRATVAAALERARLRRAGRRSDSRH
jgi:H+/Na+-translocating ferredoxin:NAD+ oxidoreductase subunit B